MRPRIAHADRLVSKTFTRQEWFEAACILINCGDPEGLRIGAEMTTALVIEPDGFELVVLPPHVFETGYLRCVI